MAPDDTQGGAGTMAYTNGSGRHGRTGHQSQADRGNEPADRRPTFGSLFAGIGGIDLGLERAGWTGRWQVEYEPFCQRVLARHWPDVHRVGDVHDAHGADYCPTLADSDDGSRAERNGTTGWAEPSAGRGDGCPNCLPYVDLIAGGFPCQPVSTAGRRLIQQDDRWLWPEFARCIRELRPRYVLVENVPGLLVGGGMDDVLGDLADLGYDCEWESIPAAAVGAPHLRYRVWIVAHARDDGRDRSAERDGPEAERQREAPFGNDVAGRLDPERGRGDAGDGSVADPASYSGWFGNGDRRTDGSDWWSVEPDVGRVAHGVPARVDRLRSLGNAVVPQVVEWIGRRILEAEVTA